MVNGKNLSNMVVGAFERLACYSQFGLRIYWNFAAGVMPVRPSCNLGPGHISFNYLGSAHFAVIHFAVIFRPCSAFDRR